ncbi:hypothetical protein RRG08_032137 [Elysia crispata]|uniref:Uncharacterized protein n=1 Tax=Elysia crispata TaxID=231223 RepID=A0AAE0ZAR8_9GAST|nr:hypothetical protein RRG08_032137 [Elysia crispata]
MAYLDRSPRFPPELQEMAGGYRAVWACLSGLLYSSIGKKTPIGSRQHRGVVRYSPVEDWFQTLVATIAQEPWIRSHTDRRSERVGRDSATYATVLLLGLVLPWNRVLRFQMSVCLKTAGHQAQRARGAQISSLRVRELAETCDVGAADCLTGVTTSPKATKTTTKYGEIWLSYLQEFCLIFTS